MAACPRAASGSTAVRRRPRGFTLIEVLVALLIVAFGMGAVLTALTSAAENTIRLRDKTFAEWVGFNQLSTARLASLPPAVGRTESAQDVEFAGTRWHWQQTVDAMDIPGLQRITITVRRAEGEGSGQVAPGGAVAGDNWLATVVGFRGHAVNTGEGDLRGWDSATSPAGAENRAAPGNGGG